MIWIDGNEYATARGEPGEGSLTLFNIHYLERMLSEKYEYEYLAGETLQEHVSLIGLGVMTGLV